MKRTPLVLAAGGLVLALAFTAWRALRTETRTAPLGEVAHDEASRTRGSGRSGAELAAPEPAPPELEADEPEPARVAPEIPAEVLAAPQFVPRWVTGRVELTDVVPYEEGLRVRALKVNGEVVHEAAVGRDLRFHVAFPEDQRLGRLDLSALHLYARSPARLWLTRYDGEEIVLEAAEGGALELTVTPPGGMDLGALADAELLLIGVPERLVEFEIPHALRSGVLDERGEARIRGLPARWSWVVVVRPDHLSPVMRAGDEAVVLAPGATERLELRVRRGVRIAGRVLDRTGRPVPGCEVYIDPEAEEENTLYWLDVPTTVAVRTDEEGRFDFRGLAPRDAAWLIAHAEGFIPSDVRLGNLRDGQVFGDVPIVLDEGELLRGRVCWPDGEPAAGAEVAVEEDKSDDVSSWPTSGSAVTSADGSFSVTGLGSATFVVSAEAWPAVAGKTPRQAERRRRREEPWRARLEGACPGSSGIVLELRRGGALLGQVVNDLGEPVERFTLAARRDEGGGLRRNEYSEDGRFHVEGVQAGTWDLEIVADGHLSSGWRRLRIPTEEQARFELMREARVEGMVLGPDGSPVGGAEVRASFFDAHGSFSYGRSGRTASDGRFELRKLAGGAAKLTANATGYAPSSEIEVDLVVGELRTDVVSKLRRPGVVRGKLHGRVTDRSGRTVEMIHDSYGYGDSRTLQTDEGGGFEARGLTPGRYRAVLPDRDQTPFDRAAWSRAWREGVELDVDEGGSHEILVGGPSEHPELRARVVRGTEPVRGAAVEFSDDLGEAYATTDADGRCAVRGRMELDEDYLLTVEAERKRVRFVIDRPDPGTEIRLVLPDFRLQGRVVDQEGKPLGDHLVSVESESFERVGISDASTRTGAGGRFELAGLPSGTYTLLATNVIRGKLSTSSARPGFDPPRFGYWRGLVIDDVNERGELELALEDGAVIAGRISGPGGEGLGHVQLRLVEEGGVRVPHVYDWTDDQGRYRIACAPEVAVRVRATLSAREVESAPLVLLPGEETTVDLVLP